VSMMGGWRTMRVWRAFVAAALCFAAGLQGWLVAEARWWERAVLMVAALLLIKPGYISDAVGLALLALVFTTQKMRMKA